jgi:hypothetical protein
MKGSLLLALLVLTPTEVVVREGESLAQVAQRTLGDTSGASELKALNGLKEEAVPPGTKLKLPGPDRERAQRSLAAARNAVDQADSRAQQREEAAAKLKEAEGFFQGARYDEAAQAADQAWKLLAASAPQPTVFQVEVAEDGATTVRTVKGSGVRVQDEHGNTRELKENESVRVEKGAPLPPPPPVLSVPQPTKPTDAQRLSLRPTRGGLGPVTLAWSAVQGAQGYEVELVPTAGERRVVTVSAPQLKLPLPAGKYRWSVRALSGAARSEPSPELQFEVAEGALRLDVKSPKWK